MTRVSVGMLAAVWLSGVAVGAAAAQEKPPRPLPADVVAAWHARGIYAVLGLLFVPPALLIGFIPKGLAEAREGGPTRGSPLAWTCLLGVVLFFTPHKLLDPIHLGSAPKWSDPSGSPSGQGRARTCWRRCLRRPARSNTCDSFPRTTVCRA